MAQVTIYLPDELAERVRGRAKRLKMSMSAYLADLVEKDARPSRWPRGFDALYGSWKGTFEEPEDPPADELPES
jgi:hypothetical protein